LSLAVVTAAGNTVFLVLAPHAVRTFWIAFYHNTFAGYDNISFATYRWPRWFDGHAGGEAQVIRASRAGKALRTAWFNWHALAFRISLVSGISIPGAFSVIFFIPHGSLAKVIRPVNATENSSV